MIAILAILLAAPAFVSAHAASKSSACATGGVACVLTLGFTGGVGNDFVVDVATDSGCSVSSVTDSGSNAYSLRGSVGTNATCGEKNSQYSAHLGTGPTTVTVNF